MSNKAERDAVGALLLEEWGTFAEILDERGETWLTTDPMKWPKDSSLWWLDHGIRRLLEAAHAIGLKITRVQLEEQHRAIVKYRAMLAGES
ncbi:hypothetical protein ACFYZ9_33630 [Streptomyces sp. NPDC001691]|uniref:hypothetical protein n=1 Tax=Streptomyces sp. NPDC001691 TaxID=3364600 RepID=UPI0036801D5B